MQRDLGQKLAGLKRQLIQQDLDRGRFGAVLEALGDRVIGDERDLAAHCHHELAKVAAVEGRIDEALSHATRISQLNPSSKAMRALNEERLRLLKHVPRIEPLDQPYDPGVAIVAELGEVPVLGKYNARGHGGNATKAILLMKKAPEELDFDELDARPQIVDRLGLLLWQLVKNFDFARRIDALIPIPPDPERYASRGYHPPDLLAKSMAKYSGIPQLRSVLFKIRPTRSLRSVTRDERPAELEGSMSIRDDKRSLVKGSTLLLIDDVVTYGTHFREARRILMLADSSSVYATAVTTAHGTPRPIE